MNSTSHNLNTFKILFIIKGILTLLISLIPLLYFFFGVFMFNEHFGNAEGSGIAGTIMMLAGSLIFLFLVALGILTLLVGKYLGEQRRYDFIFVIAIINCLTGVLGILLGVFTIIELNKPHVKHLFGKPA